MNDVLFLIILIIIAITIMGIYIWLMSKHLNQQREINE